MTNEVDAIQEADKRGGDGCVDAIAAIATVCIFVTAVIFWLSHQ